MTVSSLRKLGAHGVNTDVDPFDLPLGTFTMAVNARFEDQRVSRGPVFTYGGPLSNAVPQYVISYKVLGGTSSFLIGNLDGTIHDFTPGSPQRVLTASGWTPSAYPQAATGCIVNNVVYLNRSDRQPWYLTKGGAQFAVLPNWPTSWRAQAMRSFQGQLVVLNVTQGSTQFPSMVAWSDYTVWGFYPQFWAASATNAAGSNVLSDLGDPLIDGLALRNVFILYSQLETWLMTAVGVPSIFSFSRLFDNNYGMISQNCAVEVSNQHYVFGIDRIWKHDGYTPQDISSGRVKGFIFNNLVRADAAQFFVLHQPRNTEVMFCYRSIDPYCAFPLGATAGCNRAAVYNYRANTWYFYDLPYVTSAGFSSPQPGASYTGEGTASYGSVGGSYSSYGDASKLSLYMTCSASSAVVGCFELPGSAYASGQNLPALTAPVVLYATQLDLDVVGGGLRGYKVLKSIYPEGRVDLGSSPLTFTFSAQDYPNSQPFASAPMTFDGLALYKLDFMTAGRFMSMKVTFSDYRNFTLSGLDVDFEITGSR